MGKHLRIVFMGTPDFAIDSLDALYRFGYDIAAVVTAPDAPSGRGLKLTPPPVKTYAMEKGIPVLQPEKLKDEAFVQALRNLRANLQIVVAFRMLPEVVWAMPELGTFNLHASLLPHYRGAAPINRAIMNGETVTGLTTFFLRQAVDTGNIIFQEKTAVGPDETAGELHDRLKEMGAGLVLRTVKAIENGPVNTIDQEDLVAHGIILQPAPKLFREDCLVRWDSPVKKVHDHVRGLSPYPGAYTYLNPGDGEAVQLKIFRTKPVSTGIKALPGTIDTDGKRFLRISCLDGWVEVLEVQLAGKRRMSIQDFLLGFSVNPLYMAVSEY